MSEIRNLLGVDVGGTFTDFVAYDPKTKAIRVWKELSTPRDPVTGRHGAEWSACGSPA